MKKSRFIILSMIVCSFCVYSCVTKICGKAIFIIVYVYKVTTIHIMQQCKNTWKTKQLSELQPSSNWVFWMMWGIVFKHYWIGHKRFRLNLDLNIFVVVSYHNFYVFRSHSDTEKKLESKKWTVELAKVIAGTNMFNKWHFFLQNWDNCSRNVLKQFFSVF